MNSTHLPFVRATVGSEPICALIDSGSSVSLLDYEWYAANKRLAKLPKLQPVVEECRSVSGDQLRLMGCLRCNIRIGRFSWPVELIVGKGLSVQLLLGVDFLIKSGCILDYGRRVLQFEFCPKEQIRFCDHQSERKVGNVQTPRSGFVTNHLSASQAAELLALLDQFGEVLTDKLGVTNRVEYEIKLTDEEPVRQAPYRLSPPKMKELRKVVDDLLRQGVVRPSLSPYASPVFLVPKPNSAGFRPVVDFRLLNQKVVLESVPLPDLHNCFGWFSGARIFTVLDLNQAYYQIPLAEKPKPYTAFCTDYNLFEFNRVPFGLATGAAVLSRLLDAVLGDFKFKFVYNYLDDVVIYSSSFSEHLGHLKQVLERLRDAGLTVKPSKVVLAQKEISFLGHLVSAGGVKVDQSRTQAIYKFPVPRNKKQIARYVGMVNFFRKFIPNFAQLALPLNQIRKKGLVFKWGESQQAAFEALKQALSNAPVLGIPDFNRPFIVQTDASNSGIAAVLLQEQGEGRRPLAYASRALTDPERCYSVYELEALAVLFALDKFRFYLEHRRFQLETDNQALSWVLARPRKTGRIARWAVRISAYQFDVVHIRGAQNIVADSLSRMFEGEHEAIEEENNQSRGARGEEEVMSVSMVAAVLTEIPALFQNIEVEQNKDGELRGIREQLSEGRSVPGYSLEKGLLCFRTKYDGRKKICLPKDLVPAVFNYFHQSLCGGHLGFQKTKAKIQEHVTWKGMGLEIRERVDRCCECKMGKPDTGPKKGFLESTREMRPLEKIFADYLGPLPRTKNGHRFVFVLVDAFTRFVWLIPSKGTTSAITINHLSSIFASFGPPRTLVTDNATGFKSREFRGFCFGHGIRHITTTPYYPQPSFAERINRNLKSALVIYHSRSQKRWDSSLSWLSLAFNTAYHEAHKTTPAKLMFSYEVNSPLSNLWCLNDLLPERVEPDDLRARWESARRNILLAHKRQAVRYNRGRHAVKLAIGDEVYVKNVWGQSSAAQGITGKMLPRFVGPYKVIKVLNPVSFLLQEKGTRKRIRAHLSQIKVGSTERESTQ